MAKKKYKVDVHNPTFEDYRFGVLIQNGVAVGEFEEHEVNAMRSWGYTVEEVKEEKKEEAPKKETPKKKAPTKKSDK